MSQRMMLKAVAALSLVTFGVWGVQAARSENAPTPAAPANAAPAPPQAGAFALGYVDLVRVSREYQGTKAGQAELDTFQQSLRRQLEERENVRFLDEKELAEVAKLRAVASPNDEQKKQLNDYLATSKSREAQLRALQQNPNKSDAEKADADRLTRLGARTDEEMDALGEKLEQQLQARGEEISKKLTDTVTAAIEATAKEKGYTAIVDKKAMLYGGTDVTEAVLQQLNKK